MALPDISQLTLAELNELLTVAAIAQKNSRADSESAMDIQKSDIHNSIVILETLLGPVDAAPNLTNIRGVLGFSDAQMAANAGMAFRLVFQGLEILTKTTLDVARVVSKL